MTSLINFDAFSHGQIASKLWLLEHLERYLAKDSMIAIVGSWYNLLAFMMLTRKPAHYQHILGVDIDSEATKVADKLCNYWNFDDTSKVTNLTRDAGDEDYSGYDCVINCSVEHMPNDWFNRVSTGTLVCIQSSDVLDPAYPWLISNPNPDMETLIKKYPLSQYHFVDTQVIKYDNWGYKRFMIIGVK
jgi:hypothetical protein